MSEDLVNIEVDGVPLKAKKGAMIMQVTDPVGMYIPRFCYHEKLSVAANCRMCLVEVEKAPKPQPACATPVMEGMKVFTKSPRAIAAQKATMEFLLINHPLDCPICDQAGECKLQEYSLDYGQSQSRFVEQKVHKPKRVDLGPETPVDAGTQDFDSDYTPLIPAKARIQFFGPWVPAFAGTSRDFCLMDLCD